MSDLSPFGHRSAPPAAEVSEAPLGERARACLRSGGPGPERRRHVRIPLAVRGRYMLADGNEYPCVTRDVSRMGMAIEGIPVGAMGERVVAYLDGLGRVEGRVVRRSEDWFAIELVATPQKLERLEEKISAVLRRTAEDGAV